MDEASIGDLVGTGNVAEVFAYDEAVLKLYRSPGAKGDAFREAGILALLETTGLPTPRVFAVGTVRGRWGLVMSRAAGPSFAETMLGDPAQLPAHLAALVTLQHRLHATVASGFSSLKLRLGAKLDAATRLDDTLRRQLRNRLASLPDGDRLCHGDFHPYNVLGTPQAPTLVDWLDATAGPPEADLCRSYLLLRHGAPAFAEPWFDAAAPDPAMRPAILAWLPVLAAARLTEGVPEEEAGLLELARG